MSKIPSLYEFVSMDMLLAILLAVTFLSWSAQTRRRRLPLPPSPWALPLIGHFHLLGTYVHRSFYALASKHGPLMYLKLGSVPCVVISSAEVAQEFLKIKNELNFSERKRSSAVDHLTYKSSFVFRPSDAYWKFIKRLIQTELLGSRTLWQFLPVRVEELRYFIGVIYDKSQSGASVNITEELMKMSNNVISQMMLSIRSSGTDSQADAVRRVTREITVILGEFNVSDYFWYCKNIDFQGFRKRFVDIRRRYDSILEDIIETREQLRKKRRAEGGTGKEEIKDFLDMMLDVCEDPNSEMKVTRNHIKALVLEFFTAATDTSATTLEWALAELLNCPRVMEKARKEVNEVMGTTCRLVNESDISSLPYIQAIIKETLRLHPPIPLVPRWANEEFAFNGYRIPGGCDLFINVWAIGRDPKAWERPMEFEPERFISKGKEIDLKGHHYELIPFGSGRRGCVGLSLAMLQLPVILAAMIQCFDWKACGSNGEILQTVGMSERVGVTVPRAEELLCRPKPRFVVPQILSAK